MLYHRIFFFLFLLCALFKLTLFFSSDSHRVVIPGLFCSTLSHL